MAESRMLEGPQAFKYSWAALVLTFVDGQVPGGGKSIPRARKQHPSCQSVARLREDVRRPA